jgi:hypothetical protein
MSNADQIPPELDAFFYRCVDSFDHRERDARMPEALRAGRQRMALRVDPTGRWLRPWLPSRQRQRVAPSNVTL